MRTRLPSASRLQVADEETSSRLTARKFLAAANFLELLAIFGEIGNEVSPARSACRTTDVMQIACSH